MLFDSMGIHLLKKKQNGKRKEILTEREKENGRRDRH